MVCDTQQGSNFAQVQEPKDPCSTLINFLCLCLRKKSESRPTVLVQERESNSLHQKENSKS